MDWVTNAQNLLRHSDFICNMLKLARNRSKHKFISKRVCIVSYCLYQHNCISTCSDDPSCGHISCMCYSGAQKYISKFHKFYIFHGFYIWKFWHCRRKPKMRVLFHYPFHIIFRNLRPFQGVFSPPLSDYIAPWDPKLYLKEKSK